MPKPLMSKKPPTRVKIIIIIIIIITHSCQKISPNLAKTTFRLIQVHESIQEKYIFS